LAIDSDGSSLLIFEEEWLNDAAGPKTTPNMTILLVHIATEVKMSFVKKDDFSIKMLIFNQVLFSPLGEPKTHRRSCGFNSCTN
ncbi:hypothetical protein ALC53_00881, partial [Atta colombica]